MTTLLVFIIFPKNILHKIVTLVTVLIKNYYFLATEIYFQESLSRSVLNLSVIFRTESLYPKTLFSWWILPQSKILFIHTYRNKHLISGFTRIYPCKRFLWLFSHHANSYPVFSLEFPWQIFVETPLEGHLKSESAK